jgi:hypothetical protein
MNLYPVPGTVEVPSLYCRIYIFKILSYNSHGPRSHRTACKHVHTHTQFKSFLMLFSMYRITYRFQ